MTAYEIADDLEQAANLEMELDRPENWADLKTAAEIIRQLATEKAELEFENKAFRKELFNIGSMRSCAYAAQHHGFVSPRQAGDDAREYIAEILEKAKTKECE